MSETEDEEEQMGSGPKGGLDPHQLLALCQRIRDCMAKLELGLRKARLRLVSLAYESGSGPVRLGQDWSLASFGQLVRLGHLSRRLARLLERLQQQQSLTANGGPIQAEIAGQQLSFFTSEWYDNYAPRLEELLRLASQLDRQPDKRYPRRLESNQESRKMNEALGRLGESMLENERLVAGLATNLEYTRLAIESIHNSVRASGHHLSQAELVALETGQLLSKVQLRKGLAYLILLILLVALAYYLLSLAFGPLVQASISAGRNESSQVSELIKVD